MIKWLKKNALNIAVLTVCAVLIFMSIESCVSELNYKKQIRKLNQSISEKEKNIKASENKVDDLWKKVRASDDRIAERDEAIKKKDEEIASIRKERDSWKGKVEEMTPSEIVVETRKVLNCANIFERPDGVLFSLECAKVNLRALNTGEFSLAMEDVKKLEEKIALMDASMLDLRVQITDFKGIIAEQKTQIADERGISADWKEKFTLSEGQRKKARMKGRKEGTIIGGIIGGLIGFFLGR